MENKLLILIVILMVAISKLSWAEEDKDTYELEKIIITATKTEISQAHIGSSNTVITGREIKQTGQSSVLEILRELPGVMVSQTGGFGGLTQIYLRGSKPGHTLIMIDGIEINDPTQTDRSFNFAYLTTDNIERIEIIRGPQSTLYGSDALGGVINIITKKGKEKPKFEISFEGGSHNTLRESANLSGSTPKIDYSFSISRADSKGISKARDGAERDGYQNSTLSSRLGYKVLNDTKLNLILHLTYAQLDLDDAAYDDDPNYTAWYQDLGTKFEFIQTLKPWWEHKLSFNYFNVERKYRDEKDSIDTTEDAQSWLKGDNKKIEWQHNFIPFSWDTITSGFEYEEERGTSYNRSGTTVTKIDRKNIDNKGLYLQNQFKLKDNFFITPGLRIDDHELFGTETTYRLSSIYLLPIQTHLKANWGTGFKAPSVYQLYHPTYGDSTLSPDKSESYDFGFKQSLFDDRITFGITYFHNEFKNMVDWDPTTSKYKNIGQAWTNGFEVESTYKPIKTLKIDFNYTYTKTKDRETGLKLTRRPENQVGLNINWSFMEKANLNLKTIYVGHNWDNSTNTRKVKPYAKIDLFISYDLTKNFKVFGRIENFFDRRYEEVRGYAMPGRSFYAGGKVTF